MHNSASFKMSLMLWALFPMENKIPNLIYSCVRSFLDIKFEKSGIGADLKEDPKWQLTVTLPETEIDGDDML
jgi:hypothetical protein